MAPTSSSPGSNQAIAIDATVDAVAGHESGARGPGPSVFIGIPTLNRPDYVRLTVESVVRKPSRTGGWC